MNERSLFDPEPPARRGESTQAEAAAYIRDKAPALRTRVLEYVRTCSRIPAMSGATIEEIAEATGIKQSSVCGRIDELKKLNLIFESDLRRATRAGVKAKVWRAVT
ncbi:MAG: hypothetical protein KIS92_01045 [Planctomycetota bacterium]|nr:hypothetical protein [Planctomycetota bacterium]